jgi:hypothetical protein
MGRARAKSKFFRDFVGFQGFARRKISSSVVRRPRRRRRSVTGIADGDRLHSALAELPFETGAAVGVKAAEQRRPPKLFCKLFQI